MKKYDYEDFEIEKPFDFTRHSTIGCGGCAKIAFYPHSEAELKDLVSRLKEDGKQWITVGNLSNVLPPDEGTEKIVICTKKMTALEIKEDRAYVEAGITSGALLRALKQAGLSGAEFLIGIPCTLGGALYMNAGAGGKYIAELVESVRVYRGSETLTLPVRACDYSYKHSAFMQTDDVILGAALRLEKSEKVTIAEREKAWLQRRVRLPKGKSMGCVFKNPQGLAAGELIDKAGLKGLRIGGAKVSEEHANFIVNDKMATAKEIGILIKLIKNAVLAQYGVLLEEEIRYL